MVSHISEQQTAARIAELERTLESLREDSEVAHVLLGLSGALAEVRTVEETLDKGVRIVRELFGADRCFAAAWDVARERFRLLAHFGFDPPPLAQLRRLAEEGPGGLPLLAACLRERAPVLIGDVDSDDRIDAAAARRRRLRAFVGIPLLRWGQDFGGVGLEFSEPREFTSKDAALARGIARQLGVALANARRFNLLRQLREVGLRIGSRLRLAAVGEAVAAGALTLLEGDAAYLYYYDGTRGELVASGGAGRFEALPERLARIPAADEAWAGLLAGNPVTVHDLRAHIGIETAPASAVAVPVPGDRDAPTGAIIVFFERSFTLGPDEAEALNVLAAQSASAISNAQRYERQRRVARSLQEGLLRTELPKTREFEIHATYEPATGETEVGGDYYDTFGFPDGRVAIVVGDVSGKGAEAAAYTAMAKYMLRAFAMRNPGPSSVLYHLNNALVQGLAEDRYTTLFYGVFDPRRRQCLVALGGHPEPLVCRASGEVEAVRAEGTIVGAFKGETFQQVTVELGPGDVLVAYSDGLTEARSADGELYGRERLAEALRRHRDLPAERLTPALYEEAASFGQVGDDTVVLALKLKGEGV